MDGDINLDQLALTKFGIGQPVPHNEDPMLVGGQGRYTMSSTFMKARPRPSQTAATSQRSRLTRRLVLSKLLNTQWSMILG